MSTQQATPARRLPAAKEVRPDPPVPEPPGLQQSDPDPDRDPDPDPDPAPEPPGLSRSRSATDAGHEATDQRLHIDEHHTLARRHTAPSIAELEPAVAGSVPGSNDESRSEAPRVRHVEYTVVSRWQHPGLCATDSEGIDVRDVMRAGFRQTDWGGGALLYIDPRLPGGAHERLLDELAVAEREIRLQLRLQPPRPNVFAYQDTALLLAAACTNEDVVAYYDGDVHVVLTHADVSQSLIHEYTHHALQTVGIVGPAWAQEGIAMTVARETWWRQGGWLERVAARPFSIEAMEGAVPYTLSSEQAVAFYVQAAAMVACAVHDRPRGLLDIIQALRPQSNGADLDYELPPLAEPRAFRACSELLLR